ncbi:hypothetical protein G6011_00479 [Alternaria panax]|uniref:C3H1-type domain-containing protein n=1 Tax=Alternaria panax TaxID=48097 RepID=A0AAD4IJ45_9PLEO|nr:hypothetical protein G6011_00479 [Alternaria panax]
MSSSLAKGASNTAEDPPPETEGLYRVDCILAQKWQDAWDMEPFDAGTKYLTKWEGYPLEDFEDVRILFSALELCCFLCDAGLAHALLSFRKDNSTWEPAENFDPGPEHGEIPEDETDSIPLEDGPTALELWNEKKAKMSKANFRKLCETNLAKYLAALNSQQAMSPLEDNLADREAADSSQLNHLFVDSHTTATDNLGLFVRQPPEAHKPPILQSESSSPERESTNDSMMAEIATKPKNTKRMSTSAEISNTQRWPTRNSAQSPRTPLKRAATTPNLKSVTKSSLAKSAQTKEPRRPSLPQPDSSFRDEQTKAVSAQQRAGNSGKPTRTAAGSASTVHNNTLSGSTSSGTAKRSISFATQSSTSKTTSGPGKSSGIRIVNVLKPQPCRAPALPEESLYQTLSWRAKADKRSRREGTPDVAALNFVHAPPGIVVPNLPVPSHDLYARREPSHRRVISEEPQDNEPPRRESTDGNMLLEPWEIHKVPQACYQWRLSNNCTKSAKECRFMHRHKDEKGHDYPIADMEGKIPGKYRRPPLTCSFWLDGPKGCKKSAEDCKYAHQNTGWIKHSDPSMGDARNDPDQRPKHDSVENQLREKKTIGFLNPRQLTCWYWNRGQCRKSDQDCAYQHRNTGIIADGPHKDRPKSISTPDVDNNMDMDDIVQPHMNNEVTRTPSPILSEQSQLFSFQPPPPPPPITNEVKIKCEQLRTSGGSVCTLDFEDMFASSDGDEALNLLESRAFLMYHPEDHFEELEIITRWLLLHHVQVASMTYQGAWAIFKQQILQGGSGIIIAHPDVEYFTAFPGFGEILRKNVRLWSVGLQPGLEYDAALTDSPPVFQYKCIEIFPLGGFVYITEEVFETKPLLALEIVKLFFAKIADLRGRAGPLAPWQEVDDASLLWRLCVRPELMEYLLQRCEDHEIDLNAGNADIQSCAKLYSLLAETNYIEQDDPIVPLSTVVDKYPILSERRIIAECEPVDYFNTVARSKEAANLNMIRYYAGLQVDLRRDYRHFYVVHTEPKAKYVEQWKQEIQTIADVITPEQCIKEFLKDGQDSMFDFYERFMTDNEISKRGCQRC